MAIVAGVSITITRRYRPQIWLGWVMTVVGMGLLILVKADTSKAKVIGFEILLGSPLGVLTAGVFFPILAPLNPLDNAHAIALYAFGRTFCQVCVLPIWAHHRSDVHIDSRSSASPFLAPSCRTGSFTTCPPNFTTNSPEGPPSRTLSFQ